MKCGINMILRLLLWYFLLYGNGKSNRDTVIVVKRVFSLAKTIVVDVFVIYIPRIPLWYFLLWVFICFFLISTNCSQINVTWYSSSISPLSHNVQLSAWPEVRGTVDTDGGAYSPFRSILLVLTHDFIIIQLYGPACWDG